MNKIILISLAAIALSMNAYAQIGGVTEELNSKVYASGADNDLQNSVNLKNVEGSPYMHDAFKLGKLIENNSDVVMTSYMRFNILKDHIEASKLPSGVGAKILMKNPDYRVEIEGKTLQFVEYTYEAEQSDGIVQVLERFDDGSMLVHRRNKTLRESTKARTSYDTASPAKIKDYNKLLYITKDGVAVEVENHKRRAIDELDEAYEDQLEDFIKDKKLKFRDDVNYMELKMLLTYYVQLQNEK